MYALYKDPEGKKVFDKSRMSESLTQTKSNSDQKQAPSNELEPFPPVGKNGVM